MDGGEGETNTVSSTNTEKFIYDDFGGLNAGGDHVVLDFYKPNGGTFNVSHRYLYGAAVDQVFAQENVANVAQAGSVLWFLTDNLGTVRDILDTNGNLVQHYRYDAFGNLLDNPTILTRYLYTGREYDVDTKLQYNRNRWYDSKTGRWLSEDPIGFEGGDYNLYRYVGNDPTNATDPSGLDVTVYAPPIPPKPKPGDVPPGLYLPPWKNPTPVDWCDTALAWGKWLGWGMAIGGSVGAIGVTVVGVGDTVIIGGEAIGGAAGSGSDVLGKFKGCPVDPCDVLGELKSGPKGPGLPKPPGEPLGPPGDPGNVIDF